MAKGEGFVIYNPGAIETTEPAEMLAYLRRELAKIANVFEAALVRQVEFLNVAPAKPREGMIRGADGTNWNPGGGGKGVYAYYSGAWQKLG